MNEPSPSTVPHFFRISPLYPEVTEGGKIDTVQFLEASKAFIKIYGELSVNLRETGAECMTFLRREREGDRE